jgi:hypothetical protein
MKKGEMVAYQQGKVGVICRKDKWDVTFIENTQFRIYGSPRGQGSKWILRAVVEGSAQWELNTVSILI